MNNEALENVEKDILLDKKCRIIGSVLSGETILLEDIMVQFDLTINQAVAIFNDPSFIKLLSDYSKAKANLAFHTEGMKTLIDIMRNGNDKQKLSAIKLLGDYTKNTSSKGNDININFSLEDMVMQSNLVKKQKNPSLEDLVNSAIDVGDKDK